ncbi:MAG: energy transducer TonB [Cetobacterium sp.]|uniref:energy transducer TonB n=1 Tax=Cetobacterium sp. TaxID=2071632 RepID=UPI003F367799
MKFIIFSIFLHICVFVFGFSLNKNKNYEIIEVGNDTTIPSISVNFNSFQPIQEVIEEQVLEPIEEKVKKEVLKKTIEKKIEVTKIKALKQKKTTKKITVEAKKIQKNPKIQEDKISEIRTNNNNDLIQLSHGVFAAKNQGIEGLKYSFISQPDPEYPLAAKRISYNKEISIKVRFLIGFKGEVEEVKFYNDKDNLGFQNEVQKTLKKWKVTPVTLNNKPIKLYFYKEFKFNQK